MTSTILTMEEVERRVEEIKAISLDDEAAHDAEGRLHQDVLLAIAEGRVEFPSRCAAAALKTREIEFCRWCA